MTDFFAYSYETHEKHLGILKQIVRWTQEFARLSADAAPLDIPKVNKLLVQYNRLFNRLPYRDVKSLVPNIPYMTFEKLISIIGEQASISSAAFSDEEYKLIVKGIGDLLPYIQRLQQLHYDALTIKDGKFRVFVRAHDEGALHSAHERYAFLRENQKNLEAIERASQENFLEKFLVSPYETDDNTTSGHQVVADVTDNDVDIGEDDQADGFVDEFSSFDDDMIGVSSPVETKTLADKIADNDSDLKLARERLENLKEKHISKYDKPYVYSPKTPEKILSSNASLSECNSPSVSSSAQEIVFSPSTASTLTEINKILTQRYDPKILRQLKVIKFVLDNMILEKNKNEPTDIFILYAMLTFVNEVVHSRHLSESHYYREELTSISKKLNFFRNKIVHSLDHENMAHTLKDNVIETQNRINIQNVATFLIRYINFLLPTSSHIQEETPKSQGELGVLLSHMVKSFGFVDPNGQKDSAVDDDATEDKDIDTSEFMTDEEKNIFLLNRNIYKSKNLIYHINTARNMVNYFKYYCQSNKLEQDMVEDLFLNVIGGSLSPVHYNLFASSDDLKQRLIIEGMLQVLGEITGVIKRGSYYLQEPPTSPYLNELSIDAERHRNFEHFIIGVTDYRNESTHKFCHHGIHQALEMIDTVEDKDFDILVKEVEARLKLEEATLVRLQKMIANKASNVNFGNQMRNLMSTLSSHKAALRSAPIEMIDVDIQPINQPVRSISNICCTM